MSSWFQLEVTI